MQFSQGDDQRAAVSWYFVDNNTPWIGQPSNFGSNNFTPTGSSLPYYVGEVDGAPRPWRNGRIPKGYDPDLEPCNPQWFAGGSPEGTPGLPTTPLGFPTCCGGNWGLVTGVSYDVRFVANYDVGIELGVESQDSITYYAGIFTGITTQTDIVAATPAGLKIGISYTYAIFIIRNYVSGIELGISYNDVELRPTASDGVGLRIGVSYDAQVEVLDGPRAGLEIGVSYDAQVEVLDGPRAGLEIGVSYDAAESAGINAGVEIGISYDYSTFPSVPQCSNCQTGTTRESWSFTGSGFTGDGVVFNSYIYLVQNFATPCLWDWFDESGNSASVYMTSPTLLTVTLQTLTGIAVYTFTGTSINCSLVTVCVQQSTTIGGDPTLTITPA